LTNLEKYGTVIKIGGGRDMKHNSVSEGVDAYSQFYLVIPMPEGKEACKFCPCLKFDNDSNTRRCKLTWETITYPDISRGYNCPLIPLEEGEIKDANSDR
jgi:hypothetical protein